MPSAISLQPGRKNCDRHRQGHEFIARSSALPVCVAGLFHAFARLANSSKRDGKEEEQNQASHGSGLRGAIRCGKYIPQIAACTAM
jgi:hypothetical protein